MSRKTWLLVLLIVPAMILSACGGAKTETPTVQQTEVTSSPAPVIVRIGYAGSPDSLNPAAGMLSEAWTMYGLVYSSIYMPQYDNSFKLDIADSVTPSADNMSYTIKIKPNVKFHDGTPLTAKDVAFSLNFYREGVDFPYMNGYTTSFADAVAQDDSTVVLTMNTPVPNIDYLLAYLYILPEHIWSAYTGAAAMEFDNVAMIGSGPFKMVDYAQGELVHLAANPDYYGTKPLVDEVVFQTFSNEDAMVQAIKTGQVDMITEFPLTALETLATTENVKVVSGPGLAPDLNDIIINQVSKDNCPVADGGLCTGHPALQDVVVRQALAHATDKQQLVDIVLLGEGTPGLTLIPDALIPWFNTSIKDYSYDVAAANQMLETAGYKDVDGDGVREMPDGTTKLEFRFNWPSDSTVAPRAAEMISNMWGDIGVKLQLQALDPDALTSICCPAFDYDIMFWGWGSDPDPSFLLSVMLTDQIPTGMNETGFSDTTFDDLYIQQGQELNKDARKSEIWQMQQIVFDKVAYIIPFYTNAVQAYRTDTFTGWITDQPKLELQNVLSLVAVEPIKK
jgi:peptide/nickel transport system substrate-binding protein